MIRATLSECTGAQVLRKISLWQAASTIGFPMRIDSKFDGISILLSELHVQLRSSQCAVHKKFYITTLYIRKRCPGRLARNDDLLCDVLADTTAVREGVKFLTGTMNTRKVANARLRWGEPAKTLSTKSASGLSRLEF